MSLFRFILDNAPFLAAGVILTFCSSFGQTFFVSIFAGRIMGAYGLSDGDWGAIYSLATMVSAGVMLWAGSLTDTIRVRVLGPAALALLAMACLAMAASTAVWTLVLTIFLLRFLGQGMMVQIAFVAMARWFVVTRGKAVSIAAMGQSLGEAILPVGFVALMGIYDWRLLWVACALLPLVAIPFLLRFLRLERTPQSMSAENPSPGMGGRHWTRAEALRHPLFWLLVPALLGPPAFGTAFFFQQVHFARIKGWDHVELVALFPIYTLTAMVTIFATGALIDRVGAGRLLIFFQVPLALFFLALPGIESLVLAGLTMVLMGISQGAQNPILTGFGAEFYGTRHLGAIRSAVTAVMVLGSALGPGLTGWLIDRGMNFVEQMPYFTAYHLATSVLVLIGILRARRTLPAAA